MPDTLRSVPRYNVRRYQRGYDTAASRVEIGWQISNEILSVGVDCDHVPFRWAGLWARYKVAQRFYCLLWFTHCVLSC